MKTRLLLLIMGLPLLTISRLASAEIDKGGVLNEVANRFLTESSYWAPTITDYASWLFWTLVVISMVWTFGMMALRKADIGEFFAELVRFTITTGFFWWLAINGPDFSMDIINSLRTMAAEASGLPRGLNPSTPIDIAFDIIAKAAQSYSFTSPMDNLSIFLTSLAILACLTVVAANVLLALVTAWIIAYAGIFVLGFGGARWTSDIALNYFRSVAGIALKIMTMTLLVGIAVSIIDGYHATLSEGAPLDELLVIFVVSLVMVILVNSVPNVVASLIPGGSSAASAGSSFGAGALVGAAAGAGAAIASGGAALGGAAVSGAANMAGGASAVKAAFEKAQSAASQTSMANFEQNNGSGSDNSGGKNSSAGDTPFAQAAGFSSSSSSGESNSGSTGRFSQAASLAAGTAGELAKGAGAKMVGHFQGKVEQTAGGRLASSILESIEPKGDAEADSPDQVSNSTKTDSASPSFDSDSIGGSKGGWANQTGGFEALSSEDQNKARQSHAEWQACAPEKNTSDVRDYVSYAQERQQDLNEEVSAFVNRSHNGS